MKKILFTILMAVMAFSAKAQSFKVQTNTLAWAANVANIGGGLILTHNSSFDVNFYKTMGKSYIKSTDFYAVQLDYRYWLAQQPLQDFFIGVSFMPAHFSNMHIHSNNPYKRDIKGSAVIGCLNGGYCWVLSDRFSLDFITGVGAIYYSYDSKSHVTEYDRFGQVVDTRKKDVKVLPLNLGLNLSYIIK